MSVISKSFASASVSSQSPASSSVSSSVSSSRIAVVSPVIDHLYISSAKSVTQLNIIKYNITHVINTTVEVPNVRINGVESIRIPVNDRINENISKYFEEVTDIIHEIVNSHENVLIHCVAGVSRSATFVLAYLMKYKNMCLRDSYNYLHKKRSVVRPNGSFFQQLIDYEKKLFGKNTVRMVYLENLQIEVPDLFVNEYKKMVILEAIVAKVRNSKAYVKHNAVHNPKVEKSHSKH